MADNYLENKMEEHRRLMSQGPRRRASSASTGSAVRFKPCRVIVAVADDALREATVRKMRDAGHQVAFIGCDAKSGQALAQASGSRFYPADEVSTASTMRMIDDFTALRGEPDVMVTDLMAVADAIEGVGSRVVYVSDAARAAAAAESSGRINFILTGDNRAEVAGDAAIVALMLTHESTRLFDRMLLPVGQ